MIAGTLEIQMVTGIARLQADMNQATRIVSGSMRDISNAVGQVKSLFATLGVGLSVTGFATLVKGSIDALDKLNDLSKSTDIAVEKLAGLRLAAKQSGGDLESVAQAINKMSVNIGKDAEKFRALGITATEPLEAFKQLADIYVALEDPQQRAAVAAAVLGKSWAGAAPLLAEGGARIEEMVQRGTQLSGVTTELAQSADALNDKWEELTGTGGLFTRMVAPLLPMLHILADDLLGAQKEALELDGGLNILLETMRALVVFGGNVSFTFKTIGADLGAMAAQAAAVARGDFGSVLVIGKERVEEAARLRREFDAWEQSILNVGKAAAQTKKTVADMDDAAAGQLAGAVRSGAAARAAAFLRENKAVEDTDSTYRGLLKTLKEKLIVDEQVREVTRLQLALDALSAKQRATITADREKELRLLAEEVDRRAAAKKELEAYVDTQKMLREMQQEEADALATLKKTLDDYIRSVDEEVALSRDELQLARLEISLMNETDQQRREAIALMRAQLDVERELRQRGIEVSKETRQYLIDRKQQAALQTVQAQQMRDDVKDQINQQADVWRSLDRTAHETFISIFDSGKSAFERLRDTLKNTLFDLLYQMTLKKWIINISASVSGTGAASQAFGAANVTGAGGGAGQGGLLNLLGLGSNIGQLVGGGSGGMFGTLAASSIGRQLGLSAAVATDAGPGLALTGVGSTLSYAIPIIGAAVAAYFLLHKDKIPTQSTADMGRSFGPGGMTGQWEGQFGTGQGGAQLDQLFNRFNQLATSLGAGFESVAFYLGGNTGKEGKDPQGRIGSFINGRQVFDTGPEIPAAQLELAASRAILAALQGSTLPDHLARFLNTLSPATMDQAGIDAALQFAGALKQLHDQLTETRQPLEIARDEVKRLGDVLGTSATSMEAWKDELVAAMDAGISPESLAGWQALGAAIENVNQIIAGAGALQDQLIDRFSTEADRTARAQQTVTDAFADFGATVPQTRAELVSLIASLEASNPQHHQYLAALDAIADALDVALPELEALSDEIEDAGEAARDFAAINNKRNELTIRLLELQGRGQEALNIRRMQEYEALGLLDQSLLPLLKEIYMLEDAQASVTESTVDYADAIRDAESVLRDAYQREISEKESLIQRMGGYVQSLRQYREQLQFSGSHLSPEDRYAGTSQLFQQTARAAGLGDMDAIGRLQQVSQDFLEASRFYNASSPAFQQDLQAVISAVANTEGVASRTVDVAQLQLDALNEQRDAIFGVETAVLSVREALDNLEAKIIAAGNSNSEGNAAMIAAINSVQSSVDDVERAVRAA